ncbi:MAG: CpsD/CapB family tyrosine-protein kinase [Bryobacteraceae bacterium]|nr:CpsD/CapB family tyrosine-protein kinase [Bryobacteraceae bacterium]
MKDIYGKSQRPELVAGTAGKSIQPAIAAADGPRDPWKIIDGQPLGAGGEADAPPAAPIRFVIDRRARIIPHATEQVVLERYRKLRTKLMQQHSIREFRSLMVTSATPQEGKTLTVFNLALSFAMIPGFRVAVVDGDLRRGSVGRWLGAEDRPGLINLLEGSATVDDVILKSDDLPVHFILSGNTRSSSAELMQPGDLREHMRQISERFDLVIVDSAPVNVITDAQLLASCCDAILLVARAFITTRKEFEKMAADLQAFRIIGTVLNGGTQMKRHYKGYY